MIEFLDVLYGKIKLPDWIVPFIKLPEFLRLRGVRLSNVDSYQFKDFNGPSRWEHSIAVAYLAQRCATKRGLSDDKKIHLMLSGLLHDVATPPFGHTVEYVIDNYDHEIESQRVLSTKPGKDFLPDTPIYASMSPQFSKVCKILSSKLFIQIEPEEVAKMVVGEGDLGFLIHGTIDLDNADNVVRACLHLGVDVDRGLPLKIADWLSKQSQRPIDLENISEDLIQKWLEYRTQLYHLFYTSSDEELGREAFLQHLMRRAVTLGFPRISLIWNTDDSLLSSLENFEPHVSGVSNKNFRELVQRYKLLEDPKKIAQVDIESQDVLRALNPPHVIAWIESKLSTRNFEPMIMVCSRRYTPQNSEFLFPTPLASLLVFKLGPRVTREVLPKWFQKDIPDYLQGQELVNKISRILHKHTEIWISERPWLYFTTERKAHVVTNLNHIKDWSFRFTRNDNIHSYPSTFVYAIPANLINALGLKGEMIIDPFGGVGQTAIEAVKYGGQATSADSNSLACLFARAKLTFLNSQQRENLREITTHQLADYHSSKPPNVDNIDKWFHPQTLEELLKIWCFIQYRRDKTLRQFLTVCFSSILTSCTARKGKHHTYFADNTPLPANTTRPPYCNANEIFLAKIRSNIDVLERLYAFIERDGRDPETELQRAKVLQLDATNATPSDYGVKPNSAAAIITSPPYLCMADYTFGLRLSYYWIAPDDLEADYSLELGARRRRWRKKETVKAYFEGLDKFANNATMLLRPGGFLATVYGAPAAKGFESVDVIVQFDSILSKLGFKLIWEKMRTIQWRRGYGAIKNERVAVHVFNR